MRPEGRRRSVVGPIVRRALGVALAAGFSETRVEHLSGHDWMVVGIK